MAEPPAICHLDRMAVTELENNELLHKYTTFIYLEACAEACNLRLAVAQRY